MEIGKLIKKQTWGRGKKRTSQKTMGENDATQHRPRLITCQPRYILVRKKSRKNKLLNKNRNAILMREGGEYYLGEADASIRNAEFDLLNPSFGNIRSAVTKRIPSTRSTVTQPAQV